MNITDTSNYFRISLINGEPPEPAIEVETGGEAEPTREEGSYQGRVMALCGHNDEDVRYPAAEIAAEADKRIAELEQFARDIAHKLDIQYVPPVSKGECAYLVALEALKERAEKAEADAARLRAALEQVEWYWETAENHYCPWCENERAHGHKPDCPRQAALRSGACGEEASE